MTYSIVEVTDGEMMEVDRGLSYEEALMYIDSSEGRYYIMRPEK